MTAGDKYSFGNIWNLEDLIQMQLSKKVKTFSGIFSPLLKATLSCRHFEKKDDSDGLRVSDIKDFQRHF